MRAERMFKEYQELKKELSVLEIQLCQFDGVSEDDVIDSMCYIHPEGERVQISEVPDTTARVALIYRKRAETMSDEWFKHLLERYQYLREEILFFESIVKDLSGKLPEVVHDMVMEQMTWAEVAEKYYIGLTTVGRYRKKAIKELDQMYAMRDRHIQDYILS